MKKIIITGPTGAIGMAIINQCIKENIEVVAVVNPGSARNNRIPDNSLIHVVSCGVKDYSSFDILKALGEADVNNYEPDAWIHLAWMGASGDGRNDTALQLDNVKGMLAAMDLAATIGCKTFVGAGSQAEYGPSDKKLGSYSQTNPIMGYGVAKLCAYQMGKIKAKQLNMRFVWPRIFSVYGPYDGENTMIMSGIRSMMNGETPKYTKGEQEWDYLYSKDAARAMLLIAEKGIDGKVYCVGSGKTRRLKDYITNIKNIVNKDIEPDMGAVPYGVNQVMYLCADIDELVKDTGFKIEYEFEEGVRETYEWYKRQ